jgi:hypothetical protein
MKLKTFVVEGAGQFPYDMLRYVPCWPATENDSPELQPSRTTHRSVTMETFSGGAVTPERWKSFLWKVRS